MVVCCVGERVKFVGLRGCMVRGEWVKLVGLHGCIVRVSGVWPEGVWLHGVGKC